MKAWRWAGSTVDAGVEGAGEACALAIEQAKQKSSNRPADIAMVRVRVRATVRTTVPFKVPAKVPAKVLNGVLIWIILRINLCASSIARV
jgi:hypothetical protein